MNNTPKTPAEDLEPDEEFARVISEAIKSASTVADAAEDETGGFDAPLSEADLPKRQSVSVEEGQTLADKARFNGKGEEDKAEKDFQDAIDKGAEGDKIPPADAAKPGEDKAKPEAAAEPGEKDMPAAEAQPDLTRLATADLIKGLDEKMAGEITRRIGNAERVNKLFEGRERELGMHGVSADQAMSRLLDLNAFAQAKPDEYLAWVATQVEPDKAADLFGKAAAHLGLKVVPADGAEDDEFESEEMKALREENARLKRASAPGFGPDTPERAGQRNAMDTLRDFTTATDETGQLRHPHFEALKPVITQMATKHRTDTGKFVTAEDLERFYATAVERMQSAFGSSAAQAPASVAEQKQTPAAAKPAEKPKPASKMIDGDGQGADRRPALPWDAPLDAVLKDSLKRASTE